MKKNLLLAASVLAFGLTACVQPATSPTPTATEQDTAMPNPAAVYCEAQGYAVEIRTDENGGQYGVCIFPDGRECDEWAYYRGECGPGASLTLTAVATALAPTETLAPTPTTMSTVPTPASTGTWSRAFEGSDYGAFFDIALTQDGNVFAVGTTNHLHVPPYSGDALFMKLTLAGDVLWKRTWGGEGYEQAWSVAPAGDGGYYIFGETDSYGAGNRDFFLLKTLEDGAEDWFRTYGRSRREWPYGMLPLSNRELLIYGFTESVGGGRDEYAIRVAQDGDIVWEFTVGNPGEELVLDALETSEGDLVLAVAVEEDSKLVKLDANGNVQWTKRYELAGWQFASQIAQTADGGFLLAGFSMSSGSRRQADTWLARGTSAGELEWETSFGEPASDDYAQSLIRLDDGTYLIGGLGNGMLLTRIDDGGSILWRRSLAGQAVHGAEALIELEDRGYLVAGFIQLVNGRSYDAILLRTDAEGRVGE